MELRGYKPFSYQLDVHRLLDGTKGTARVVTVKSRRQCGKSLMIENELLRWSINYPKSINACLSPTFKQSKKMFREIVDAVAESGIIASSNGTDGEIRLVNGSSIIFRSAEQGDALRGLTVTGILCIDEACFIPTEIFFIVLPWTDFHKAPILITSTPKTRSGWFYDYFMRGLRGEANMYSVDWCNPKYKEDLDKILSPEKLELYRQLMPKALFESEYLGQFTDDSGGVFGIRDWYRSSSFAADYRALFVGIDWGTGEGADKTAIVGLNENGEEVLLKYWNNIPDPLEQIREISKYLIPLRGKIKSVLAEKNSIGDVYLKLLQKAVKAYNINVQPFDTSNFSKRDIVEGLAAGIGEGNVKLLDEEENRAEFGAYRMEITRGGSITYNGAYGFNDDLVIATALANKAKGSNYGNYNLSFIGRR